MKRTSHTRKFTANFNVNTGVVLVLFGCSAFWAGVSGAFGQIGVAYVFAVACVVFAVLWLIGCIQERNAARKEANEKLAASIEYERLRPLIAKARAQKKRSSHLVAQAAAALVVMLKGA